MNGTCQQYKCSNVATHQYILPGQIHEGRMVICESCKPILGDVARKLGMFIRISKIEDDANRESR